MQLEHDHVDGVYDTRNKKGEADKECTDCAITLFYLRTERYLKVVVPVVSFSLFASGQHPACYWCSSVGHMLLDFSL